MSERTFRRYLRRVEEEGVQGILDKRLTQASSRRVPVDEALALVEKYRSRHDGWNVKHFHTWYRKEGGSRSYTWVKKTLQENGAVQKAPGKGKHRKRRERAAWEGMMIHQDASRHPWVSGQIWDLVVTMDDATNEHYSMFFVAEDGTASIIQGMWEMSFVESGRNELIQIVRTKRKDVSNNFKLPRAIKGVRILSQGHIVS